MEPYNVVRRQSTAIKFMRQSNMRNFIKGLSRWTQQMWCELPYNVSLWTH